MTRKDYIKLADALADARRRHGADPATLADVAARLAHVLRADNYRFDKSRWYARIGDNNGRGETP